jgi:hypothetical protein
MNDCGLFSFVPGPAPKTFSQVDLSFGEINGFQIGDAVVRRDESTEGHIIAVKGGRTYSAVSR